MKPPRTPKSEAPPSVGIALFWALLISPVIVLLLAFWRLPDVGIADLVLRVVPAVAVIAVWVAVYVAWRKMKRASSYPQAKRRLG
jgi:hypothetical protein